ncbi:MAG: pentapeptide repeat-containing protein [Chitinophagales bacterium]|nr:pentapeptide repeat-containing protein [Chitinophagales bacterium]
MKDSTKLSVQKPLKWYNQQIKFDFKKIFLTLSKAVVSSTKIDGIQDTIKDLFDLVDTVKIQENPGILAYQLILKAMVNAAHDLSCDVRLLMDETHQENESLYDSTNYVTFLDGLNQHLEDKELSIDRDFFKNPGQISLVEDFKQSFKSWLRFAGLTEQDADNISNRLPAYFVLALNQEWKDYPGTYDTILKETETPFTPAAKRELEWARYSAFLQKQIEEPVFAETFSLRQIYIPLRAYTKKVLDKKESASLSIENNKLEKTPFWLGEALDTWLKTQDARQCIRFISGGPGSGKSSFAKMWCAERAKKNDIKTILIPLQYFDVQGDIPDAVDRFVRRMPELDFSFHPLGGGRSEKILLVFDGLDELSQQGKFATEVAGNFIHALNAYSSQINRDKDIKALFLITGRELSIQLNTNLFRAEQDISYVLPYFLEKENIKVEFKKKYFELLQLDQRHEWWRKFSLCKGLQYTQLPTELRIEKLDEVTAQPLLNYLVALGLVRNKIDFSKGVNLNIIYKDLIEGVHERAYAQKHKAIEGLSLDDFVRILEEIAISAWHSGDIRTTTVDRITKHIQENNLKPLMDKFEQEAQKGIIRLLTAFYFREHGTSGSGDKTFEFTHKSFGEYLTAARIVNMAFRITTQVEDKQKNYDKGWSDDEALKKWGNITGMTAIDTYLMEFIRDEIKSKKITEIQRCQRVMARLLSKIINDGMPNIELRRTHAEERIIERNCSEALMVIHSACARNTKKPSPLKLATRIKFGEWCVRLQPQRMYGQNCLAYESFDYLDIKGSILHIKDLYGVDFSLSNLIFSELTYSNLVNTQLVGTHLKGARLESVRLEGANLEGANLEGANLEGAHLEGAHLEGANLKGANLEGANLKGANLKGANLKGAGGLTKEQLMSVRSLFGCTGIPPVIETHLRASHPQLFVPLTERTTNDTSD